MKIFYFLLNEFSEEFDNLSFETSNYSAIQHSKCEPLIKYINEEIDNYIENVYLKLENNVIEDEESLKHF